MTRARWIALVAFYLVALACAGWQAGVGYGGAAGLVCLAAALVFALAALAALAALVLRL